MNLRLPTFGRGSQGWTGFDVSSDGAVAAVCVRASAPGRKPQLIRCAHGTDGAVTNRVLDDIAGKFAGVNLPCTLALPRGEYQMLVLPEPPVLEKEMDASLRWSLASMIEFPVE